MPICQTISSPKVFIWPYFTDLQKVREFRHNFLEQQVWRGWGRIRCCSLSPCFWTISGSGSSLWPSPEQGIKSGLKFEFNCFIIVSFVFGLLGAGVSN